MEIGISVTSAHPKSVDARAAAQWVVERAAAVQEAGFASFSIGDHHATPANYMQNVPMLGRCLAELGAMPVIPLFLLPLWHPVLLAEQVSTLAAIAKGPVHCILAVGDGEGQFAPMGVSLSERRSRMEEAVPLVRRLLTADAVSHEGKHWSLRDVSINPKPVETPQLWIGAGARVATARAARLGDAWLAAPGETLASATEKMAFYRETLSSEDRQAAVSVYPIRRDVYIGESDAEAEATAAPIVEAGYRGVDPSALIVGGPETAVKRLQELESVGFDHTLIRFLPVGQEKILASIRRVGSDVIPALSKT
ncbi:MAG: LLM class flavin-dependent oxidoreductase [Dehalococcoidia bacterium]